MIQHLRLVCLLIFPFVALAQKPDASIDVKHYNFSIAVTDETDVINGIATITFKAINNLDNLSFDLASVNPAGKGMKATDVSAGGQQLKFTHTNNKVNIIMQAKAGEEKTVMVKYSGQPSDGLIISKTKYGRRSFFADNWPDRGRNWMICVDDPADKAAVDFEITAPQHYQVVANGILVEESNIENGNKLTHWKETIDLPTKVMTVGIAEFAVDHIDSTGNVQLSSWVFPEDRIKGFYDFRLAKDIIPFFEKYVAPFPYRKLANVQSKTVFGGLENAGAIFYSQNLVTGTRRAEPTIAHEIAHQWFGDMATETDFSHVWLSEGFATFMTMFYMEKKYGVDSVKILLSQDREQTIAFAAKKPMPVVDSSVSTFMELLNANSYQKGGWVLQMLRSELGEEVFWKGIQLYYKTYGGKNARTADLQKIMETVSGKDLGQFFYQWLFVAGQPELKLTWKYNKAKKVVTATIVQQQPTLFVFPLMISVVGKAGSSETIDQKVSVNNKTTSVDIPVNFTPATLMMDKDVKLLFSGK